MLLDVHTREGYDVATALRGPDWDGGYNTKLFTTCVLRYFAGCEHGIIARPGAMRDSWATVDEPTRALIKSALRQHAHFTIHWLNGMAAMAALANRHGDYTVRDGVLEYVAWWFNEVCPIEAKDEYIYAWEWRLHHYKVPFFQLSDHNMPFTPLP